MGAKPDGCKWLDLCNCGILKVRTCNNCTAYGTIDSGFGVCKALPEFIVVAWCRDICGLFKLAEGRGK